MRWLMWPLMLVMLLTGSPHAADVSTDVALYEGDCAVVGNALGLMPRLSELGEYQTAQYTRKESQYLFFISQGMGLYVDYAPAEYAAQKERLLGTLPFLDGPVRDTQGYTLLDSDFLYRGHLMKAVPDEVYGYCESKSFMLVGFHDEAHSIAYLYFYDMDRDYIAEPGENPAEAMCRLIDDFFLWQGV